MKKMKLIAFLISATCLFPLGLYAVDTTCTGQLPLGVVYDNVVVPSGAVCVIGDPFDPTVVVQVNGNVTVFGSLVVYPGTTIGGDVTGEPGYGSVSLQGSGVVVEGSVWLEGGSGGSSGFEVGTEIRRNFVYEGNANQLRAMGGLIGGTMKVEGNTGGGYIYSNNIGKQLRCKDNVAPSYYDLPLNGGDNITGGHKTGQCTYF